MTASNIIALIVVLLVVALIVATWREWCKAHNRNKTNCHVSRLVQDANNSPRINRMGEVEWQDCCDQMPTFKGKL